MESKSDTRDEFHLLITEEASRKLREFLRRTGKPNFGLRLRVIPSINGSMYEMDFQRRPLLRDIVIEDKGIRIFIDKLSLESVKGSEIEFIDTEEGSCFRLNRIK